jgi:hypothetical protein
MSATCRSRREARSTSGSVLGTRFATALRLAAEGGAAQVSAFIPGSAEAALSAAVHHGMRIISDAADVLSRLWRLGSISASQSRVYVSEQEP